MQTPVFECNSLATCIEAYWIYLIPCIVLGVVIGQVIGQLIALLIAMYFDR